MRIQRRNIKDQEKAVYWARTY